MYSPRSIIRLSTVGALVAAMAACAPRPEPEPIQPDGGAGFLVERPMTERTGRG